MVKSKNWLGILLLLALPLVLFARPQDASHQHQSHQHDQQRLDEVNKRGDKAMGFSHEKTTHHFRLADDGGAIEVTANEASDSASLEQIKTHLSHIAKMFKEGDFSTPMFTHGEVPPGVPAMTRLKSEITYKFEPIEHGGRVRITTANAEALAGIHDFLRYQIKDHQTGDTQDLAAAGHSCATMTGACPFAKSDTKSKQ
jgi:hypothetical protein